MRGPSGARKTRTTTTERPLAGPNALAEKRESDGKAALEKGVRVNKQTNKCAISKPRTAVSLKHKYLLTM